MLFTTCCLSLVLVDLGVPSLELPVRAVDVVHDLEGDAKRRGAVLFEVASLNACK